MNKEPTILKSGFLGFAAALKLFIPTRGNHDNPFFYHYLVRFRFKNLVTFSFVLRVVAPSQKMVLLRESVLRDLQVPVSVIETSNAHNLRWREDMCLESFSDFHA